jgi:hypothetical protein
VAWVDHAQFQHRQVNDFNPSFCQKSALTPFCIFAVEIGSDPFLEIGSDPFLHCDHGKFHYINARSVADHQRFHVC